MGLKMSPRMRSNGLAAEVAWFDLSMTRRSSNPYLALVPQLHSASTPVAYNITRKYWALPFQSHKLTVRELWSRTMSLRSTMLCPFLLFLKPRRLTGSRSSTGDDCGIGSGDRQHQPGPLPASSLRGQLCSGIAMPHRLCSRHLQAPAHRASR